MVEKNKSLENLAVYLRRMKATRMKPRVHVQRKVIACSGMCTHTTGKHLVTGQVFTKYITMGVN